MTRPTPRSLLALALLAAALSVARAQAPVAAPAGVGPDAPTLVGEGSLRWLGLKIYDAKLWAGPAGVDASRWQRTPFTLELRYARALDGESIAKASAREIERLGLGSGARLEGWLGAMRRVFPDVRAGDRIAGVYRPGGGASFFLNGRGLGSIDDPEFAAAFFSIWLDARSAAPELRAALLPDADGRRREAM